MEKLITGARKLGLQLNPRQLEQFTLYYQELIDWNQRVSLTKITDYGTDKAFSRFVHRNHGS
jgi:16S rRNA (guanine527-N7)-methyltransferase